MNNTKFKNFTLSHANFLGNIGKDGIKVGDVTSLKFQRVIRDVKNERTRVSGEELVLLLPLVELQDGHHKNGSH
jgi:hypothetical protein